MPFPKTLFLTPTAVSNDYSPGMFIGSMCQYFPHDALDCFALLSKVYVPNEFSPDMDWLQREILNVADEYCVPPKQVDDRLNVKSLLHWSKICRSLDEIADRIARRVIENKTEVLWVYAGGPFVIATALRVCKKANIPAAVVVLDPPEFLMNIFGFTKPVQDAVMDEFAQLLQLSQSCAAVSEAMKSDYESKYGVPCHVFYLPIEKYALREIPPPLKRETITIGFGGYMQFPDNFGALVAALNQVDWRVCGRDVKIKMYSVGHQSPVEPTKPENVEYCDYIKGEGEAVLKVFSDIDIGYLPFWLSPLPEQILATKYCFPTKLSLYVSAGCPIFFHGPEYCSAATFLGKYPFGTICSSVEPGEILQKLTELIENQELRSKFASARSRALEEVYGPSFHREQFARFLGAGKSDLLPAKTQVALSFEQSQPLAAQAAEPCA